VHYSTTRVKVVTDLNHLYKLVNVVKQWPKAVAATDSITIVFDYALSKARGDEEYRKHRETFFWCRLKY
jgi:hypothetical protein